jgi:hypothetical protein
LPQRKAQPVWLPHGCTDGVPHAAFDPIFAHQVCVWGTHSGASTLGGLSHDHADEGPGRPVLHRLLAILLVAHGWQ